jgi:hypothetical protein
MQLCYFKSRLIYQRELQVSFSYHRSLMFKTKTICKKLAKREPVILNMRRIQPCVRRPSYFNLLTIFNPARILSISDIPIFPMQSTRTCYGRAVVEARSTSYQNLANFLEVRFTIIYIVSNNYCASTDTDRRNLCLRSEIFKPSPPYRVASMSTMPPLLEGFI